MLNERDFKKAAALSGRVLGAQGGESYRAGFFMDMLAKWLWQQKSNLLEISGKGVDIHSIDQAAEQFCHYLADKGPVGFTQQENPDRFIPKLKQIAKERVKIFVC